MSTGSAAYTQRSQAVLAKLTVPQLKALCKDNKLSGYSKLGKQALVQKLVDSGCSEPSLATPATTRPSRIGSTLATQASPAPDLEVTTAVSLTSTPQNDTSPQGPISQRPTHAASNITVIKPPAQSRQRKAVHLDKTPQVSSLGKRSLQQSPSVVAQQTDSGLKNDGATPKGIQCSIPGSLSVSRLQERMPSRPSAEAMPPPPAKKHRTIFDAPTREKSAAPKSTNANPVKNAGQSGQVLSAASSTSTTSAPPKRFKPLVVDRSKVILKAPTHFPPAFSLVTDVPPPLERGRNEVCLASLEESLAPVPTLGPISIPPSLVQRKRVYPWAVILSGLTDKERAVCVLVSRAFRYAIYLSASCILTRNYRGCRLQDDVLRKYSQSMTNMWPYLRMRADEFAQRQRIYYSSFLARFFKRCGLPDPIAERLWASPDNPRQLMIAVRFALTRAWFELSVGTARDGKFDADSWLQGTIVDVQEIVQSEIWSVAIEYYASSTRSTRRDVLYVLEATCEVVGRPTGADVAAFPVRADWSAYIAARIAPSSTEPPLFSRLKWACVEEYDRGISKLWLKRAAGGGPAVGDAQQVVAERYVMACVVGNSISGPQMGVYEMAQEFAGLRERFAVRTVSARTKNQSVNLYLPEHHHVESVHFESARGESLHSAVAVVQTPHREYFILRDNGMQIGCEEEGVAPVWQEVLECRHDGT